jgi:hypothetical protein
MLRGKMYSVSDAHVAQAVIRSSNMSIQPFLHGFANAVLDEETASKVQQPGHLDEALGALHAGFAGGNALVAEERALDFLSHWASSISSNGVEAPNLYLWVRDLISRVTFHATLGRKNPFEKDDSLMKDIWSVENAFPSPH